MFFNIFYDCGLAEGLEDGKGAESGEVCEVEGEVLQQGGKDGAAGEQRQPTTTANLSHLPIRR